MIPQWNLECLAFSAIYELDGVFSISTCLCQPMDRVNRCLELTDIKVHQELCLKNCMNIRSGSVDVEPRIAIRNCEKQLLYYLCPSICMSSCQNQNTYVPFAKILEI